MAIIGLWLAWVCDTERWELMAIYAIATIAAMWKWWDYRD